MPLDLHQDMDSLIQLPLALRWTPRLDRRSYISARCNADALAMMKAPSAWPAQRLALSGLEGSGKSHLGAIWADERCALRVDLPTLREDDVRDIAFRAPLLVEDCDAFFDGDAQAAPQRRAEIERAMHHLLNVLAETEGAILLTGRTPPARWGVNLPDLRSRLSAITVFRIEQPDDALIPALFTKLFRDRSVKIPSQVAQFLATRTGRSYVSIAQTVDRLDRASIAEMQPVTIPFAKDILGW